jgi:hypothetical protein
MEFVLVRDEEEEEEEGEAESSILAARIIRVVTACSSSVTGKSGYCFLLIWHNMKYISSKEGRLAGSPSQHLLIRCENSGMLLSVGMVGLIPIIIASSNLVKNLSVERGYSA